jgi:hypothetical protein
MSQETMQNIEHSIFVGAWNAVASDVHETAKSKGWWDDKRSDSEAVCHMHDELSEAHEGMRNGNPPDDKVPEFSAAEAEYADTIIRIMDHAKARGWRVAEALIAKAAFNKTRPYKHGKKF